MHSSSLLAEDNYFGIRCFSQTVKTKPDLTCVMCQDMQGQGGDSGYYAQFFFSFFVNISQQFGYLPFFSKPELIMFKGV